MKQLFLMAMAVLFLHSCQNDDVTADSSFAMKAAGAGYDDQCAKPRVIVSGDITTAQTWSSANVYVISGIVRVKAALTITAGTYIIANPAVTTGSNGVLVITKAGSINAVGTTSGETCSPIVFTSWKLLDCDASTVPAPGDFGGVVILGEAPVNTGVATNVIEGLNLETPLADFQYGGTVPADNSGIMSYVRIEYAGRIVGDPEAGNEINGLTLGGVGSGTVLNHIQVSYGKDDAFEFFGGTVNASYLVAFAQDDDGFDFDLGYRGAITRALALADRNSTHSQSSGAADSNGIELDNNASGTVTDSLLITRPNIRYLSIVGVRSCADGGLLENGIHIRRSGQITLRNSTVSGYDTGIYVQSLSTPVKSLFVDVAVNAFVLPTTVNDAVTTPFTNVTGTTAPCPSGIASSFGTAQPFFFVNNSPALDFETPNRTNGAFAGNDDIWTACWTKFSNF